MAARRRIVEFPVTADELAQLEAITRSRTEPAIRVERARMLLAYHANPSSVAVGERIGVMRHTVRRCVRRAEQVGVMAALDDSPRPGKAPVITPEARAWLVSLACQKAKDLGYPHELWTTRLLARHATVRDRSARGARDRQRRPGARADTHAPAAARPRHLQGAGQDQHCDRDWRYRARRRRHAREVVDVRRSSRLG